VVATSSPNPLNDSRVREAIQRLLSPDEKDPVRAKQFLAEAGWPRGFSVELPLSRFKGGQPGAEMLRNELAKISVEVKIKH
jgi:ABC-type transport system substrate-binding protein